MQATWTRQEGARVRLEWGPAGVEALAADHVVIVDVLRFTTAVDVATGRGAAVYPYRWKDETAVEFARSVGAVLADGRDPAGPSLSPARLAALAPGDRVVLPSPNGSTCAALAEARGATVVAACLRNARAVARALDSSPGTIAVIACGERWPDDSLRPAIEDLLGAGAVIGSLSGSRSAEAEAAARLWEASADRLDPLVRESVSGREQVARGWSADLALALEVDVSTCVPTLVGGAFRDERRPAS